MKKILLSFLLLSLVFIVQAQDAKPTKEQTINYLKQNLINKKIHHLLSYDRPSTKWDAIYTNYKIVNVDITECTMKISYTKQRLEESNYSETEDYEIEETNFHIDFSKVASVLATGEMTTFGERIRVEGMYFLVFTEQQSDGTQKKFQLPFLSVPSQEYGKYKIDDDQIFRAFNHLRKLCGAPEPITF